MMLGTLCLFIGIINAVYVPKFQYMQILEKSEAEYYCLPEDNDMINNNKEELKKGCQKNPQIYGGKEMCDAVVDSYLENICFYPEDGGTIDSFLKQINEKTELLIIENSYTQPDQTIDFNNLEKKISVIYYQHDIKDGTNNILTSMVKSSFDGSPKSIRKFLNEYSNQHKKVKSVGNLQIVGNIKEKVSSLAIRNANVKVIDHDLDIDTLILDEVEILTDSKKIITNNLHQVASYFIEKTVDFSEYKNIIQTQSFQFFDYGDISEPIETEICFSNDHYSFTYIFSEDSQTMIFPYNFAKTMGMISVVESINFKVDSDNLKFPEDFALNLSFQRYYPTTGPESAIMWWDESSEEEQPPATYTITVRKDASWVDGLNKPKIIINTDDTKYIIDTKEIESVANVVKDSNDETNKPDPGPDSSNDNDKPNQSTDSSDDTNEPDVEPTSDPNDSFKEDDIKVLDVNEASQVSSKIQDSFSDGNEEFQWDKSKDNVLAIKDIKDEIPLKLELTDSQFILPSTGAKFVIESGNLNLMIPDEDSEITVKADITKGVPVSVKGGGTLIIEPKDPSQSPITLTLNSKLQLNSTFNVKISSNNVESLKIDSISLHKSEGNDPVQIKAENNGNSIDLNVDNIIAQKEAVSSLSNIIVNKKLTIEKLASLELNDVKLKSADISLNLDAGNSKPIITGNLKELPKSFVINKVEGSPKENTDYVLIKADFNCDDWNSKLKLDGTGFNKKQCRESSTENAYLFSANAQELVISKSKDSDKNKLKPAQIAGIVVGCVLAVAIIVIVVVVIIKRKKKYLSESENGNEEDGSVGI